MTNFNFENLKVKKAIAHTINVKKSGEETLASTYDKVLKLDGEATTLFQIRITDALGNRSHGVNMEISRNSTEDPMFYIAEMIIDAEKFIGHSKWLAKSLQKAHTNPAWPGGVMIVIAGTIGAENKNFIAIIKAETEKGFSVIEEDDTIQLKLVKDMLLSPHQRLYKVAMVVENAVLVKNDTGTFDKSHFLCFLFDHMLTSTETGKAATYFYETFLGMSILTSDAKYTKIFYEETKEFINRNRHFSNEEKASYREALRVALKDNSSNIHTTEFSEKTFPEHFQDEYLRHMESVSFPKRAVIKDAAYIKRQLKKPRTTLMTSGVRILVPSDQNPAELVSNKGTENGITTFEIKGVVQGEDVS